MDLVRTMFSFVLALAAVAGVSAQAPAPPAAAKEPPPRWDAQVGASFVGTSGNTDTSTIGADFAAHTRGAVWQFDTTAAAIRASTSGTSTAERYLGALRAQRTLTPLLKFTAGEKAERDRLSGIAFRNVADAGLGWGLVRSPAWTLDGTTSLAWNHESWIGGPDRNDPVGVLQALSRVPFGAAGDTTQRFTFYPDFRDSSAYRSEAEVTAQAALNSRLALKLGYLWRYSNSPVPGFVKTDNTATASVVVRWRSAGTVSAP